MPRLVKSHRPHVTSSVVSLPPPPPNDSSRPPLPSADEGSTTNAGGSKPTAAGGWLGRLLATLRLSPEAVALAVAMLIAGALYDMFKGQSDLVKNKLLEYCYVSLEIRSHQPEFTMAMRWLSEQDATKRSRHITPRHPQFCYARRGHDEDGDDDDDDDDLLDSTTAAAAARGEQQYVPSSRMARAFIPGYGVHKVTFRGHTLWITREIDRHAAKDSAIDRFTGEPREVLNVMSFSLSREIIEAWYLEIKRLAAAERSVTTAVFMPDGSHWAQLCSKPKRPLDTLVLPLETAQLPEDVRRFFGMRDTYRQRGLPWRRGYLFTGLPGTGKSSLILAMASHANAKGVYMLSAASSKNLDDEKLLKLVNTVPPRSLLVIEDIDTGPFSRILKPSSDDLKPPGRKASSATSASSSSSDKTTSNNECQVTLSGLLNSLDGVAASEGRVLIMTSNSPACDLPAALVRPGRVDKIVSFGCMTAPECTLLLAKYGAPSDVSERFGTLLDGRVSAADVQGAVMLGEFNFERSSPAAGATTTLVRSPVEQQLQQLVVRKRT